MREPRSSAPVPSWPLALAVNPVSAAGNPYVPLNLPALGDLFDIFDFGRGRQDEDR